MGQDHESFLDRLQTRTRELIHSSAKDSELVEMKQQKIVDGALKLFVKKGFHPTSIQEIADACGMSMGQLYHYISSKDDVLFLVHKRMQTAWHDWLWRSQVEEIKDPVEKLREALFHTLEFLTKNKALIQFVYRESKSLNKKHLRAVLEMEDRNVVAYWRQLLGEAGKKKKIETDLDFAANVIAYLNAFLPLRGWNLKGKTDEKHWSTLVDFILKGLDIE